MDIRCTFLERIEALSIVGSILVSSLYFFLDPEFQFLDIRFLKSFATFLQEIWIFFGNFGNFVISSCASFLIRFEMNFVRKCCNVFF